MKTTVLALAAIATATLSFGAGDAFARGGDTAERRAELKREIQQTREMNRDRGSEVTLNDIPLIGLFIADEEGDANADGFSRTPRFPLGSVERVTFPQDDTRAGR